MARAKILLTMLALILAAPIVPIREAGAREESATARTVAAERSRKTSASAPASRAWWLGTTVMILALGGAGAVCMAARGRGPVGSTVKLQVVGRVHLPPRHAIFAVRAGGRTLLVGAGPQGAPTLLGELDDESEEPADASAVIAPASRRPLVSQSRFDVRIGDES